MKGEEGDPSPEETTLKKATYIRVKKNTGVSWELFCEKFSIKVFLSFCLMLWKFQAGVASGIYKKFNCITKWLHSYQLHKVRFKGYLLKTLS